MLNIHCYITLYIARHGSVSYQTLSSGKPRSNYKLISLSHDKDLIELSC